MKLVLLLISLCFKVHGAYTKQEFRLLFFITAKLKYVFFTCT